jgi:hypothetical protein
MFILSRLARKLRCLTGWKQFACFEPINAMIQIAKVESREAIPANERLQPFRSFKLP